MYQKTFFTCFFIQTLKKTHWNKQNFSIICFFIFSQIIVPGSPNRGGVNWRGGDKWRKYGKPINAWLHFFIRLYFVKYLDNLNKYKRDMNYANDAKWTGRSNEVGELIKCVRKTLKSCVGSWVWNLTRDWIWQLDCLKLFKAK